DLHVSDERMGILQCSDINEFGNVIQENKHRKLLVFIQEGQEIPYRPYIHSIYVYSNNIVPLSLNHNESVFPEADLLFYLILTQMETFNAQANAYCRTNDHGLANLCALNAMQFSDNLALLY
ncbi:unnamed protein product, partial [Didymodactylos carnosus]